MFGEILVLPPYKFDLSFFDSPFGSGGQIVYICIGVHYLLLIDVLIKYMKRKETPCICLKFAGW